MFKRKFFSIAIGITLAAMVTACSSANKDKEDIPTLVKPPKESIKTVKAHVGYIENVYSVRGSAVPEEKMEMSFGHKGGNLAKLMVRPGDTVKVGDVLAELDDDDIRYTMQLQDQKVKLAQLDYDEAVAQKSSDYAIKKADINLKVEKLALEKAKEDLQKCILTSQMEGKVINVADLKLGDYIEAYKPIVTVANTSTFQVQCNIANSELVIGRKVNLLGPQGQKAEGEVVANSALESTADSTGNIVVVKLIGDDPGIRIGDAVQVVCILERKQDVVKIPRSCLKYDVNEKPYIEIYKNDDVIQRFVGTGIDDGEYVEIVYGVEEGDDIITE
jgi:macrolide-specific efflux system membrane fusion protein